LTRDDTEIVLAVRASLASKVGQTRFDLWFGAGTRLDYNGRVLRIGAPNQFFLDWIRGNFRRPIEEACHEVLGKSPTLEFLVDASGGDGNGKAARPMEQHEGPSCGRDVPGDPAPVERSAPAANADRPAAARDGLPVRRFATLESYVAGEANRLALTSAQMVVRRPGQVTPLMFYGPTSVGKTHLLEGIWTAARKSHERLSAVYLSAEQFTSHFLEALRGSGLPSFRRKYRGVALLMVDDLQFFVGKRATQIELLHTIDGFLRDGRQLIFAADRSPADLAELGSELTTRLASGLVCRLEPPDQSSRLGIVAQMARRMKLSVPPEVQKLIASRLTSHARELSGALCRLQAASEALQQPISLALAEQALADLIRHNGRVVRLPDIEKAVCDVFGLEPASLQSDAKGKRVSHPRMLAMWLARKHTRAALSEIGHYFGRRSHSTVISAQKRVDGWMTSGRPLDLAERRFAADDAVRQVERRLAAG
jgi:chromosomal replication initiator protein